MAWEDPWKRYWRRRERLTWDPWFRYEEERRRWFEDPWYRFEKERERMMWDTWYRAEKQRTRSWGGSSYGYGYGSSSDYRENESSRYWGGASAAQSSGEPVISSGIDPATYSLLVEVVNHILRKEKRKKLFGFLPWPF